ncbi:uncharacterized protein LOC126909134 isoform X25 [Daktulosphaira vitifoliae]|uniref:uncharacterized protein LOC126909134 isoform X24 n=1 Tax=Daktulosphaira vitifoliae TaxID=58002 RepID=UPI0021AA0FB0|nr:uncharacterized protein LOC126909134 isoform X24 [Daktulosphaira vitifoliae]XP_050547507.1 uncharacterized protein LOC126909134 isoform X25 [Daktulosphaira vitifoliae]
MNSLTIFMTILVFAVDLSLALECNCCGDTEKLQMVSCRHYYCNTCTNKFTRCTTCRTEFILGNNNRTALNVLKCAVCGNVKEIKKGSSCTHIHCENCLHYITNCFTCKKIIRDAQILTCSICSLPNILYEENNKIYCTSCQSLGFVPQETGASSSRQNNVRPQFGVPTSNQSVPSETEDPLSNQSVPSETEDPLSNQSVPSETEDPLSNQCDDTEGSNRPPILYNFFS